ncbi:hypothetical protein BC941DRAFT_420173 [Chlamydoabsidia padenii]|nr:hypothetical protein BC941DRAFT_420173 [Chlamydoabsidia padenii]
MDITSSLTSPTSPQPSYDLASLLPPDMKIPEQLLELIKSSLAASINEKGASSGTKPSTSSSTPTSPTSSSNKATTTGSSSLTRQLLPKPTSDGSNLEIAPSSSTEVDKRRPLSIVTQLGTKRARSDNSDEEDGLVSMDELLDTSQLDARPEDGASLPSDDRFARDLSRWERVPIGAFRLMRSKNRLWLNR